MEFIFYLIIFSVFKRVILERSVVIPIHSGNDEDYFFQFDLGEPKETFFFLIDTSLPFNLISTYYSEHFFSSKQLKFFSNLTVNIQLKNKQVSHYSDILTVKSEQITIPDFSFYQTNETTNYIFSTLSFSRVFIDKSHSLLHRLKKQGFIDNLKFTLFSNGRRINTAYFGQPPPDLKEQYSAILHALPNNEWSIEVDQVIINDNIIYSSAQKPYVVFRLNSNEILVGLNFFNFLLQNVFGNPIESNICSVTETKGKKYLLCHQTFFKKLNSISFVFQGISFNFPIPELLFCLSEKCSLKVVGAEGHESKWEFGTCFLKFYTIIFDYEKYTVSFYNKKNMFENKSSKRSSLLIKNIFILISFILVIGSFFILIKEMSSKGMR